MMAKLSELGLLVHYVVWRTSDGMRSTIFEAEKAPLKLEHLLITDGTNSSSMLWCVKEY